MAKSARKKKINSKEILSDLSHISQLSQKEKRDHRRKSPFMMHFNQQYQTLNTKSAIQKELNEIRRYFLSRPKGSIHDIYDYVLKMYDECPSNCKNLIQDFIDEMDAKWVRSRHGSKR